MFIIIIYTSVPALAQSAIHGKVLNSKNEPAVNASVLLLFSKDSSLIKAMISDNNGAYSFNNINEGSYLIEINLLGYKPAYSNTFIAGKTHNNIPVDAITLTEETTQLKDVIVTARKPLLEQKIDRLVINVASSITSSGNTALEVLERSPGVVVNRQNNTIAMNGKQKQVCVMSIPIQTLVQKIKKILLTGITVIFSQVFLFRIN